jgi:hypothetical protein
MPTRRKKDSPAKLSGRMKRRWRVDLLRNKGEMLGEVEAPDVASAKAAAAVSSNCRIFSAIMVQELGWPRDRRNPGAAEIRAIGRVFAWSPDGNAVHNPGDLTVTEQQQPRFRIQDNPSVIETYANRFLGAVFDGAAVNLTFGSLRLHLEKTDQAPTQGQQPVVQVTHRLTLSPAAAIELINSLNLTGLKQAQAQAQGQQPRPS